MKKFIITGGAGFIGSTLVKALLEKGAESILIIDDLSTGSESNISSVLDDERIEFFNLHLKEILKCLREGLTVKGYFAWSLLDNYEWAFGYTKRFGLVYVDFDNFNRIPKKSYYEFSKYLI